MISTRCERLRYASVVLVEGHWETLNAAAAKGLKTVCIGYAGAVVVIRSVDQTNIIEVIALFQRHESRSRLQCPTSQTQL